MNFLDSVATLFAILGFLCMYVAASGIIERHATNKWMVPVPGRRNKTFFYLLDALDYAMTYAFKSGTVIMVKDRSGNIYAWVSPTGNAVGSTVAVGRAIEQAQWLRKHKFAA